MKEFWDDRFAGDEYAYGTLPNHFFKQWIDRLKPGRLLLPGEGEGRNAVYAASRGWHVDAFDQSDMAKIKAIKLAERAGVTINYNVGSIDDHITLKEKYDLIALVFLHLRPDDRRQYHRKLLSDLNPGGLLLIESFSKEQIHYKTGGPANTDMLYSLDDLTEDLNGLKILMKENVEVELEEGRFHQGKAHLSRIVGSKRNSN